MSDIKRVQFTTISSHTSQQNFNFGGGGSSSIISGNNKITNLLQNHKLNDIVGGSTLGLLNNSNNNTVNKSKTFRYELELFEPDSESFPEFSFANLLKLEKKKQKKLKQIQTNGITSDPFEENDDDVARIAKEMEMKYGKSYISGRRKTKYDDLCDKGLGYDESDSFIDNTEAYDEIIPDEVETIAGGFYINSGQLEFKNITKYEIETEEIVKMVKSRKRIISTSSSSSSSVSENDEEDEEDDNEDMEIDLNSETEVTGKKKNKKRKTNKHKNGHRDKKPKSSGEDSTSSKSKGKTKKNAVTPALTSGALKDNSNKGTGDINNSDSHVNAKEKPALKTTTVKDMLKAKRDNYLKMQDDKKLLQNGTVKSGNDSSESTDDDDEENINESGADSEGPSKKRNKTGIGEEEDTSKLRSTDTKLPENLSTDVMKDIKDLIENAKTLVKSGKKFQFDGKNQDILLRCDDNIACLSKDERNSIFAHLEYQMQFPKHYLVKKIKQLRVKVAKSKIKKAYIKLKNAIAKVMPSVINSYEATYKQVSELKSKSSAADLEKSDSSLKLPRKKFPWNDAMRNLLYDLYQTRWTSYTVLRKRKEKFEDFVTSYLRDKVVPIWPNGWMKLDELQKELERRKLQAKKVSKDSKKSSSTVITTAEQAIAITQTVNSKPNIQLSTKDENLSSPSLGVPITSITSASTITTNESKQNQSVLTKSSTFSVTKQNFNNEVPKKLPDNSITITPIGVESTTVISKTPGPLNNNNFSIDKKSPASPNLSANSSKVDHISNSPKNITQNSITVDLVTPAKLQNRSSTDHSICNIMSSPSPPGNISNQQTLPERVPTPGSISTRSNASTPTSSISSTTHVINVDDFKSATDIIQTSKLISMTNNNPSSGNASKTNKNDKIISNPGSVNVINNNNAHKKSKESKAKKNKDRMEIQTTTKPRIPSTDANNIGNENFTENRRRDTIESISSSSDSVEFIDEKPPLCTDKKNKPQIRTH